MRGRRWFGLAAMILLAAGCSPGSRQAGALPVPEGFERADPEVVALVEQRLADVRAAPEEPDRWMALGFAYEANRLLAAARRSYERAVALDPSEGRWWYRLAVVRGIEGDVAGAVAAVRRVAEAGVSYAPAYWRLGSWLLDLNEIAAAAEAFRRAAELDPDDAAARIGLARVALQGGEPQQAADLLERLLSEQPDDPHARQLLAAARRQLGLSAVAGSVWAGGGSAPHDPWTDEVSAHRRGAGPVREAALQSFRAGRFAQAAELFERLRRRDPTDFSLLNQLGAAQLATGRSAEALAVLQTALEQAPDHFETHFNLAGAYLGQGDVERALEHADRAIAISPGQARAHERKGAILVRAGRDEAAVEAFQAAIRHDPGNLTAVVSLGMLHYNRGDLAEAIDYFERAGREDSSVVEAHVGVAMVHMDLHALSLAAAALEPAIRLAPDHPHVVLARRRLASLSGAGDPPGR